MGWVMDVDNGEGGGMGWVMVVGNDNEKERRKCKWISDVSFYRRLVTSAFIDVL